MKYEDLVKVLLPWNFWERDIDIGVPRKDYLNKALEYLKSNKIVTVIGVRRAGKSFITKQIAEKFDKKSTLIINFEEVKFPSERDEKLLDEIYEAYKDILNPNRKPLIVLDEVQEVKNWERFVRTLDERKEALFVVTGSSAKIMSEELATLLTGRTLSIEVFPLGFREFLGFNNIELKSKYDKIRNEGEIRAKLKQYLQYGGFPEIVLAEGDNLKTKILRSYYDDILNKDIIKRFNIRRIEKLERLAFFYITNFSSPITFNSISKFLKIEEKVIETYSKYLELSKMIYFIQRFSSSVKEQENSPRKVYIVDTGLHKLSNILLSDKVSKLYENVVAVELLKNYGKDNIYYWKDLQHREVDFVINDKSKVKQLIQVCYDISDIGIKKREIAPLIKASRELKCRNLLVITEDKEGEEIIDEKRVKYIPLWRWLLG